jgi:hypothetical protein
MSRPAARSRASARPDRGDPAGSRVRLILARATGAALASATVLGIPAIAAAHGLSPVYQSPLPRAV